MPHESEIIHLKSITQPVIFGEHADPHEAAHKSKCRVWWFAALPVLTFILGLLIG
jgi:hypothetical protein